MCDITVSANYTPISRYLQIQIKVGSFRLKTEISPGRFAAVHRQLAPSAYILVWQLVGTANGGGDTRFRSACSRGHAGGPDAQVIYSKGSVVIRHR